MLLRSKYATRKAMIIIGASQQSSFLRSFASAAGSSVRCELAYSAPGESTSPSFASAGIFSTDIIASRCQMV